MFKPVGTNRGGDLFKFSKPVLGLFERLELWKTIVTLAFDTRGLQSFRNYPGSFFSFCPGHDSLNLKLYINLIIKSHDKSGCFLYMSPAMSPCECQERGFTKTWHIKFCLLRLETGTNKPLPEGWCASSKASVTMVNLKNIDYHGSCTTPARAHPTFH